MLATLLERERSGTAGTGDAAAGSDACSGDGTGSGSLLPGIHRKASINIEQYCHCSFEKCIAIYLAVCSCPELRMHCLQYDLLVFQVCMPC